MSAQDLSENRSLLGRLGIAAVVMFGFGFLLVPFYEKFCEATGFYNILQPSSEPKNTQVDRSRVVTIEFDANTHKDLAWTFRPKQSVVKINPGELTTVTYEVTNTRDRAVTGQAVPSYGPQLAGRYFLKMDCFCFTQQTLQAGETREMPVAFLIDPDLPQDVGTVVLSYTFFEIAGRNADSGRAAERGG
ncbi:cytochrome c oxidase assembly protein [Pseudazoarcus pumilus]|uniref:Cytochrome c oxidase assembly protein CtaG n=1 Tax=Pseudazoarcus pumilus TaxID=2067960 RepID=A0A2I6S5N7_9RHOO|nr:cytochrome c oxidase assembly protein [Pseudazoarcus pumilus]AUN94573.1 cytochrome c oxidase assembly protein [Pseudazoarcus pumilus]